MKNDIYKIYQIIEYFVNQHGYATLYVQKYNKANEIWLYNFKHKTYQLIRINTYSVAETRDDIERINNIIEETEQKNKQELVMLDLHIRTDIVNQDEIYDTVCLNEDYYDGPDLEAIYPDIKKVIHEVDDVEGELKQRLLSINKVLTEKRKEVVKKELFSRYFSSKNLITLITCGLCIILFLVSEILTQKYDNSTVLIFLGADYKIFTLGLKQYWRLFTCAFLHGSAIHLACNMFSLLYIGSILEEELGKLKYSILLICGIIIASLTHGVLSANSLSIGISGGIYALFAYFLIYYSVNRRISLQSLMPTICLNIFLNFLSNVAWQAHLGGALCGVLFYYLYKDNKIDFKIMAVTLIMVISLFYKYHKDFIVKPFFGGTDSQVIQMYQDYGLTEYANKINYNLYKIYLSEDNQNDN